MVSAVFHSPLDTAAPPPPNKALELTHNAAQPTTHALSVVEPLPSKAAPAIRAREISSRKTAATGK